MCLFSYNSTPTIATRNIKVYKVLWYNKDKGWTAPILGNYTYKKGINTSNSDDARLKVLMPECLYSIGIGYLHSVKTKRQAKFILKQLNSADPCGDYKIVKMFIPKGSKYFKSFDNKEYCSDKLLWHLFFF